MIEINIQLRIGSFQLTADIAAEPGLIALFGRSGAGKTMLVNAVAGLVQPDAGRIKIGDHVLFDSSNGINLAPEKRRIGYIFQDARLFPHLNVRANLVYGMKLLPPAEQYQDLGRIVELLGLQTLLDRRCVALSGGEKQRIAIGRALLTSPRILLMDEPLAALDAQRKNEILPYIERLRDDLGVPVIYVTHAVEEVVRLADTLVVLSDGKTVATGAVEDIMSRPELHPMTGRYEAGAVFAANVTGHDARFDLTNLSFAGGEILIPRIDLETGATIRVRIRARDVTISLTRPTNTSMLNCFAGKIRDIETSDQGPFANIVIDIGAPLIARITKKSLHYLELKSGMNVFALTKAVAIDRHSLGRGGAPRRHD